MTPPEARLASPWRVALLCALVLAGVAGCGKRTYPVDGKVSFADGRAASELAGGLVTFESVDGKVSAQGVIQEDGSYRLSTDTPDDGAYPGEYRVAVSQKIQDEGAPPVPQVLDPRFSDLEKSGLKATVKPEANQIPLTVGKRRPR